MKRTFVVVVILAGYAWAMTGVTPFSTASYLLVAIPCIALAIAYLTMGGLSRRHHDVSAYYEGKTADVSVGTIAPWIALLSAAVILEAIGLALGGRSTVIPTLSTAVDHLLEYHWERCLLGLVWLHTGAVPLLRLRAIARVRDL